MRKKAIDEAALRTKRFENIQCVIHFIKVSKGYSKNDRKLMIDLLGKLEDADKANSSSVGLYNRLIHLVTGLAPAESNEYGDKIGSVLIDKTPRVAQGTSTLQRKLLLEDFADGSFSISRGHTLGSGPT